MKQFKNVEEVLMEYFDSFFEEDLIEDWIDDTQDLFYFEENETGDFVYIRPSIALGRHYPHVYDELYQQWYEIDTEYMNINGNTWRKVDYLKARKILEIQKQMYKKKIIEEKEKTYTKNSYDNFWDLEALLKKREEENKTKDHLKYVKNEIKEHIAKSTHKCSCGGSGVKCKSSVDDSAKKVKDTLFNKSNYDNINKMLNDHITNLASNLYEQSDVNEGRDVFNDKEINETYNQIFEFLTGKK